MAAIDPRQGSQLAYIATTEATVQPGGTGPAGSCIMAKRIRVYQSLDLGTNWSVMAGSDSLPQGQWATDPAISVGGAAQTWMEHWLKSGLWLQSG